MPYIKSASKEAFHKNVRTFYRDFRARGYSKAKARSMAVGAAFTTRRAAQARARKRRR